MIDYGLLQKSIDYYKSMGYTRIESPWLVTEEISDITKPPEVHAHKVIKGGKEKVFVASGEQSFLYLINKGFLPSGNYQTVTPCLRDDNFGKFHTKYFIKNELIHFNIDNPVDYNYETQLESMLNHAMAFFETVVPNKSALEVIHTEQGYDINYADIEIGSYGIRHCEFVSWVYGTGCALPRFSRVIR